MKSSTEASKNRASAPIPDWEARAARLLRVEMSKRSVSFKALSRSLERLGVNETPAQVSRKINRGKYSAAYMLACLEALGVKELSMADIVALLPSPAPDDADTKADTRSL